MAVKYHIICNGKEIPINSKTLTWIDDPGWRLSDQCFRKLDYVRKPSIFVNHHDQCLSSRHCISVLERRRLSVHFLIDYDGTIYQLTDTNNICWHAKPMNYDSIGVEINNPVFPEYQSVMRKQYKERPMIANVNVHGKVKEAEFLWFHEEQLVALKELWKAVHSAYGIPFVCPVDDEGQMLTTTYKEVKSFSGFISHLHITDEKIDPIGLDLKTLLKECEDNEKEVDPD